MQKKYFTTIALVLTVLAISSASAFAATGQSTFKTAPTKAERLAQFEKMDVKFEEMKTQQEEVSKAVLAGDYKAWKTLISKNDKTSKILQVITEDKFAQFSKAHKLMEESRKIMEELGLEKGLGMDAKFEKGKMGSFKPHGRMMKGFGIPAETK